MFVRIEPEPSPEEREAIVAVVAAEPAAESAWGDAALAEGIEADEPDP